MKSYLADFNEISKAQVDHDQAQALDDLNIERQGLSVGRTPRFLGDNALEAIATGKRGKDGGDSALEFALLSTTSFTQLYDQAWDGLRNAEAATERALERAEQVLADNIAALSTTLDRAATLPEGPRMFRDENGQVRNEHGEQVDPVLAATIEWQGHEPSYEAFLTRSEAVADAQERIAVIRGYQVTLGEHRETIQDKDNVTRDQVEDVIDRIESEMPDEVREELDNIATPSPDSAFDSGLILPDLSR